MFAVKPISLNLLTRRLEWVGRAHGGDVVGWVTAVPRDPAAITRWRYAWFILGGPLANALFAVLTLWAASTGLPSYDRAVLSLSTLAGATGLLSAFLAIFNLFPSARAGVSTDGVILFRTWRADADWRQGIVLGSLGNLLQHGARPRDRPSWISRDLQSLGNADAAQAAAGMEISAALDSPPIDASKVRSMIEVYRKDYGDGEWLASCDAYLAAVWEDGVAHARAVRWQGETTDQQRPLRLAVDAAIAAREGDRALAEDLLRQMRVASRAEPWMRAVFRDIDDQVSALLDGLSVPKPLPKSLTH